MNPLFEMFAGFSSAEEFLQFFGIAYRQEVVNVNRLHILQRFHQYLRQAPGLDAMDETALRAACKPLLARAYEDFVDSSAIKEKVFKVFRDAEGTKTVSVEQLRAQLPPR